MKLGLPKACSAFWPRSLGTCLIISSGKADCLRKSTFGAIASSLDAEKFLGEPKVFHFNLARVLFFDAQRVGNIGASDEYVFYKQNGAEKKRSSSKSIQTQLKIDRRQTLELW